MQSLLIVLMSVAAAVFYGVLQDQVTARICVEYFTIGHEPLFDTADPTLLGLGWGVVATWWVGALLGVPLAVSARAGNRPKRSAPSLLRPLARMMVVTAVCASAAGICGWLLGRAGAVELVEPLNRQVPPASHAAFLADVFVHSASYLVGVASGVFVIAQVWRSRRSS